MPLIEEVSTILLAFFLRPTLYVAFDLFIIFGWALSAWGLIYVILYLWKKEYKQRQAKSEFSWKLLAIDIPKENIQTPKAVEQMFAHLSGALVVPNLAMTYRRGFKQRKFSLEIVSIEGYIQFLIRTEEELEDLVEAAVYAQYPEAEIVEVEDYVDSVPDKFPNETHEMWAADFTLTDKDVYPIRTYREFEHSTAEGEEFKDPMSSFLESFSKIGEGEQLWFQFILKPIPDDWKEDGIEEVKDIIGEQTKTSRNIISQMAKEMGEEITGRRDTTGSTDEGPPNKMLYLTPGEKNLVEKIEDKISKIGFGVKMRGVYVARKEVYRPKRGVHCLIGAINQFNVPSCNSIKPTFDVDASFLFADRISNYRKNLLMYAYKNRKRKKGASPNILNIEELATLWHFPMAGVKTPMIQKSKEKQSEPPSGLPTEGMVGTGAESVIASEKETTPQQEEEKEEEKREFG